MRRGRLVACHSQNFALKLSQSLNPVSKSKKKQFFCSLWVFIWGFSPNTTRALAKPEKHQGRVSKPPRWNFRNHKIPSTPMSDDELESEVVLEAPGALAILSPHALSHDRLADFVRHPNAGAIATFEGVTRRLDANPAKCAGHPAMWGSFFFFFFFFFFFVDVPLLTYSHPPNLSTWRFFSFHIVKK
jgi:hypothetical protein